MVSHRSPNGRRILWSKIIEDARRVPGSWVVQLPNERTRLVALVRNQRSPKLRFADGKLEAKAINAYRDDTGVWRGDIYIRFLPKGRERKQ